MGLHGWFCDDVWGEIVLDPWDLIKLGWILLMILFGAVLYILDIFG
jgi:hypothetical protein